jgi:hypothetical protein
LEGNVEILKSSGGIIMRETIIGLLVACVFYLAGALGQVVAEERSSRTGGQTMESDEQTALARQWKEVKKKYPLVAMEILRRDAFAYQMAQLTLGSSQASQEYTTVQTSICYLFARYKLPLPAQCKTIELRIGDIGGCFEPQPSSSGGYEAPSVEEAEACVEREKQPQ